jgi:hypothetical protein
MCFPAEADELRLQWGKNELEEKSKPKWLVFVELVRAWLQQLTAELWALQHRIVKGQQVPLV